VSVSIKTKRKQKNTFVCVYPRCWHRDFSGVGREESERGGEGVAREAIAIGFLAMAERSTILTLKY